MGAVRSFVPAPVLDSPPLCLPNVVAEGVLELGRPHGGGVPEVGGQFVELAAIVAVGDPHGLAIGEAGSGGEAHRSVACELREL